MNNQFIFHRHDKSHYKVSYISSKNKYLKQNTLLFTIIIFQIKMIDVSPNNFTTQKLKAKESVGIKSNETSLYESVVDLGNPIYLLWKELMWKVEDSQRRVSGTTQPRWNRSRQQQTEKTNVRRNRWAKTDFWKKLDKKQMSQKDDN